MRPEYKIVARSGRGITWRVCDYSDRKQAASHQAKAQDWAKDHEAHCHGKCSAFNPYDAAYGHEDGPVAYTIENN